MLTDSSNNHWGIEFYIFLIKPDGLRLNAAHFLIKLLGICSRHDGFGYGLYVWTAGQREELNDSLPFVWKPNVNTSLPMGYSNWIGGQPIQWTLCQQLVQSYSFLWDDIWCDYINCVLCECGPY